MKIGTHTKFEQIEHLFLTSNSCEFSIINRNNQAQIFQMGGMYMLYFQPSKMKLG